MARRRILICRCEPDESQEYFYVRLIEPPDRAVNLHPVPPRDDGFVAEMQVSEGPMMQRISDVELFERNGLTCFADVCVLVRHFGLHRWSFTRAEHDTLCFRSCN